jgi:serine/threonine-protein kinase
MGVVYLAEDLVLQRKVALKILYPALSSDEEFIERFRQEARLVSGVVDPHVVHINNLEVVEHRLAIDMEYVDGLPLNRYIAQEFVTPAVALRITRDMLRGLSACHYHGLVHCDIKPSNVLLPTRGQAKLADFGLAHAYSSCLDTPARDKSTTGLLFGTPIYSPPEMWDGAKPSPASDLFSVGVVLYEMLSGQVPYSRYLFARID